MRLTNKFYVQRALVKQFSKRVPRLLMQNKLGGLGSTGAIVAAAACPICFPKLALLGAIFGLGALASYETVFFFIAQILVVLSLAVHMVSYKKHRNRRQISLVTLSVVLFFVSLYLLISEMLSYVAFAGLAIATIWLVFENRRCASCAITSE